MSAILLGAAKGAGFGALGFGLPATLKAMSGHRGWQPEHIPIAAALGAGVGGLGGGLLAALSDPEDDTNFIAIG